MQYPIIIKKSPLALVKNIIVTEMLAGFLLFASTLSANYEKIYYSIFAGFIRYDYLLIILVSFSQIIITLFIFLRWHNENYEIREKGVISRKGIFNITQNSLPINDIKSIIYSLNSPDPKSFMVDIAKNQEENKMAILQKWIGLYGQLLKEWHKLL